MNKSATILVTGGGGMVGRSLLDRLRHDGYAAVLAPSSKQLDLRDRLATERYFSARPIEYVFHLAGRVGGIGANVAQPFEFLHDNLMINANTIETSRTKGVKKLLYLSSSCVYPRDCPQPMREESLLTGPFEPTNEGYAIAKLAGMKLCEYSNREYGTDFITLMPCNLFGYGDHFEPERSHVVSALMYKFHVAKLSGDPSVEVWGTGSSQREFMFITDVADAMMYFMSGIDTKDIGGFINVGSGQAVAIRDLAHMIRDVVGYSGEIVFNASKPDGMPRKLMDASRATRLGWRSRIEIRDGLQLTYDWYRGKVAAA